VAEAAGCHATPCAVAQSARRGGVGLRRRRMPHP
jgi:hypothetical protein